MTCIRLTSLPADRPVPRSFWSAFLPRAVPSLNREYAPAIANRIREENMQLHSSDHVGRPPSLSAQPNHAGAAPETPTAAQSALVPCVYIALQCSHCGDVRQARAELPVFAGMLCPECGTDCSYALLGKGLTSRKLPFSEICRSQTQLLHRRDEAPEISSLIRGPSG
jgi:hypothetical protein